MAQPTFEQFFRAIAEQESGGNYKAIGVWVGGDRAYGKYQIMGANIPSWTKKYLGKSMTPQQFLNSPSAQEKVAKGHLKSYYDKYGARGAASAWYSGNPSLHNSTKSQPGGPSIKGYVDSVVSKAYKYPAGGGKASTKTTGSSVDKQIAKTMGREETAESYGFMVELFDSTPELKALFNKAVKGGWTPSKFQAELRDTKWWKKTGESTRKWLTLQYGDPATAKQQLNQMQVKIAQMAKSIGLSGASVTGANMRSFALKAIMGGWDEGLIRYNLGKKLVFRGDTRIGEAGENVDKIEEYAYNMGINVSDSWLQGRLKKVASGTSTLQDIESEIRVMAKALFPQWAKQLDAGQTTADIASPYMSSMAQILELPAGSINLFDNTVKKALQYKDPQTGANSVKPLWQFENELRSDNRWKGTQNAQNSLMQVAHQVLADFGVKY